MKKINLMVSLLLISGIAFAQGIHFEDRLSWQQILKKAKKEQKYILMDCYATWCGPCKMMDKEVYPDASLGEQVNKDFISVKVQVDQTKADDDHIKSWYNDAKKIVGSYKVAEMPTILFFTPNGDLTYRKIGAVSVQGLKEVVAKALTNPIQAYNAEVKLYQAGNLPFDKMPALAKSAKEEWKDRELENQIARKYIDDYLYKLEDKQLYTHDNIRFIIGYAGQITSNDRIFRTSRSNPNLLDVYRKDLATDIINLVIAKEEITAHLWNGTQPVTMNPDWNSIYQSIKSKYGNSYDRSTLDEEALRFYQRAQNWISFVDLQDKIFKKKYIDINGQFNISPEVCTELNIVAWDVFLKCSDKSVLSRILNWSAISLNSSSNNNDLLYMHFDTYANILYRLGQNENAIAVEIAAIELCKCHRKDMVSYYTNVLDKMKKGEPTWN